MTRNNTKQKVALITGATSGIGKATALLFSKKDIIVVATGRNKENGKNLVKTIENFGGKCHFIRSDLSDPLSIKQLFQEISQLYDHIDYAVNNASIEGKSQRIYEIDEINWDNVINTNLKGTWLCLKYEFQMMKKNGGAIINTSSCLTKISAPYTATYTTSKAGVEALTKVAAIEYGEYNIRVNSILPGAVDTEMLKRIYNQEEIDNMRKTNPLKRIASPEDIANTIYWLCTRESKHINGTSILIDGGHTLL